MKSIERKQRALHYLAEACEVLAAAHRARAASFPFTTLNEQDALSNLRRRLKEWDAAHAEAVE